MRSTAHVFAAAAAIAGLVFFAPSGQAAEKGKEHKIVFQIDQNDQAKMNLVLNNVQNTLDYYHDKNEDVKVEVVAYGPGLNMLRDDKSPVKDRLKRMVDGSFPSSLQFSACHHTMMGMEKQEGHPIPIVAEAKVVPSGVVRLNELQEQGWSYIRP